MIHFTYLIFNYQGHYEVPDEIERGATTLPGWPSHATEENSPLRVEDLNDESPLLIPSANTAPATVEMSHMTAENYVLK